jgi:hypothetical protein
MPKHKKPYQKRRRYGAKDPAILEELMYGLVWLIGTPILWVWDWLRGNRPEKPEEENQKPK